MNTRLARDRHVFELMLLVVVAGMAFLMYRMGSMKMVVQSLFFMPIVLSGYYRGRTVAGALALFSAIAVTIATCLDGSGFGSFSTPIMVALALTVWAGVLGLTAILVGTLCDERATALDELHQAYVGVVEVVSKYLQGGNPHVKTRTLRVAELCQRVAEEMRLPLKYIDDIRVGALLYDLGSVEVTAKVIRKAVDTLEAAPQTFHKHTFMGGDLVESLGTILQGAAPLVVNQEDALRDCLASQDSTSPIEIPLGAKIIRTVRAYDSLISSESGRPVLQPKAALKELARDATEGRDVSVLQALARVIDREVEPERASGRRLTAAT